MRDYQESVTIGQTDTHTDRRRTKWSLCAAMLRRRHKKVSHKYKYIKPYQKLRCQVSVKKRWRKQKTVYCDMPLLLRYNMIALGADLLTFCRDCTYYYTVHVHAFFTTVYGYWPLLYCTCTCIFTTVYGYWPLLYCTCTCIFTTAYGYWPLLYCTCTCIFTTVYGYWPLFVWKVTVSTVPLPAFGGPDVTVRSSSAANMGSALMAASMSLPDVDVVSFSVMDVYWQLW